MTLYQYEARMRRCNGPFTGRARRRCGVGHSVRRSPLIYWKTPTVMVISAKKAPAAVTKAKR
jgi:hypothetical protein